MEPVVIKKYENRRLYDSTHSRYINLDEIAEMVKQGRDVRVVDAASGEDLTRVILTQIIMEDAREPNSAFPLDILRQMVLASGKATQESALQYMKAMFDMYQNAYRVMTPPMSPFEFMQTAVARPSPKESNPLSANPEPQNAGVGELHRRVEELESLISRMNSGIAGSKNPTPRAANSSTKKSSRTPRKSPKPRARRKR
jgi:polyhydroxyalkanoate synthesis repressor PhaR